MNVNPGVDEHSPASGWVPTVVLLAVTAVFGWTFVIVKDAISQYPVIPFLGLRFGLAAALLLIVFRRWPRRAGWIAGLPAGVALALGYLAQTEGMVTVSPGVAGLLTGLFVVFTPILDRVLFGARVRRVTAVSIAAALGGTVLLTLGRSGFSGGDLLVMLAAGCFATQIVVLSRSRGSVAEVSLVQVLVCALAFLVLGAVPRPDYHPLSATVLVAVLITGILASGLAVLAQTWAQRRMSASRAGLVLAAEPGFALLFAVWLAGQRLSPLQMAGAAIVLAAILGHEFAWTRRES